MKLEHKQSKVLPAPQGPYIVLISMSCICVTNRMCICCHRSVNRSWEPHSLLTVITTMILQLLNLLQLQQQQIWWVTNQQNVCSEPQSTDRENFIRCWLLRAPAPPSPLVDVIGRVYCCVDELSVLTLSLTARQQPGHGHHLISGFVSTNACSISKNIKSSQHLWLFIKNQTGLWSVTCHMGSQCFLPPDTGAHPASTPVRQTGSRFTYPRGMEGWVGLADLPTK